MKEGKKMKTMTKEDTSAEKHKAVDDDGERTSMGTSSRRAADEAACSICGKRSHEYSCAFNYMDGFHRAISCREQCSPGRHTMQLATDDDDDDDDVFVRVTNLPSSMSERELLWLFQRFGPLRKCVVSREATAGGGFGFVTFHSGGDAEAAIDQLNGHRVGDRRLRVDWAYPRRHAHHHHAA